MEKNISINCQLTDAQLGIISNTGKISGSIKDLLICTDNGKKTEEIKNIKNSLKDLMIEIYKICYVLNIDFNEIIGGINDKL